MTTQSLSDLRRLFYGGGSAAEYEFLKSANAMGVSGAVLLDRDQAPGACLARAISAAQFSVVVAVADAPGMSITFTTPVDRDVTVIARVPSVGSATAGSATTIQLTDEANVLKDQDATRTGTGARNHSLIVLEEFIPAGSGQLTRKIRGFCATADGYANLAGGGRITLKAVVE